MCKSYIGTGERDSERKVDQLEQVTFNSIRNVLTNERIEQSCRDIGYGFRRRVITPVVTVLHMVMAAIWPEESFTACWQVLWDSFVSWFPDHPRQCPSRGRVAEARARLPLALWQGVFEKVSIHAQALSRERDRWKGHRVVLVDGTCVSMSDTPELKETFGVNTGYHGNGRYPLARLVTLCLAGTRVVIDYAVGAYRDAESALALSVLKSLRQGDLLIGDRHFAAAHFYVRYHSEGLEFLTRAHQRLKIARVKRQFVYSATDFIGRLNVSKLYRRRDPTLPSHITVRFIQARVSIRGQRKDVWFVTSLLDAQQYPASKIVALYAQRWRIETLFREVKVTLSADVLRSQSPDGVRKELIARLVALNVVRTIMVEAAIQADVDPDRISFAHTIRAVISFSPALARSPVFVLQRIYEAMLTEITAHLVPLRPGRLEPRAIRRDHKRYPALKVTRAQWRQQNVA